MSDGAGHEFLPIFFEFFRDRFTRLAGEWVDDPDAVVADAAERFEALTPSLPYLDDPGHPMAMSMFFTATCLSFHLALRDRGVGAHDLGPALMESVRDEPVPDPEMSPEAFAEAGARSLESAAPNEFVFEVHRGEGEAWGVDVKSCAVCHLFSKHDAMEFVPYMCAMDDVVGAQIGDGLRRSGTIALGATHCDFRYDPGGEPAQLAVQFPDRIRVRR